MKTLLFVAVFGLAHVAVAQKAVGDTLSFTVMAGGSVTVPAGEEWEFVSLSYSQGGYSMRTTYDGPDTMPAKYTWIAPTWNIEAQLLGDGSTDGFYVLKAVIKKSPVQSR